MFYLRIKHLFDIVKYRCKKFLINFQDNDNIPIVRYITLYTSSLHISLFHLKITQESGTNDVQ